MLDVSEDKTQPMVFINPEILGSEGSQVYQEGCLSVPGIYADVKRAETVAVRALDRDGQPFELTADGLLAVCIQHEMDHLAGKVFVDYLSPLKRELVRKKLAKQQRLGRRRCRRRGLMALRIVFAGTPEFAVPALRAAAESRRSRRGLHAARSSRRARPAAGAVAGQARGARRAACRCSSPRTSSRRPRASNCARCSRT